MKAEIGILGLGVMGTSLAQNFASKGIKTAVYNVPFEGEENVVIDFMKAHPKSKFIGGGSLEDFISTLARPRAILLMIKAGEPIDEMIRKISPLLDKGDIIIDGGNSFYKDTIRRFKSLEKDHLEFVGVGISGGEEGALKGPAMMPSGSEKSKERLLPLFKKIAAIAGDRPCAEWIGKNGSGHFVKMVHNGIEYADMQLLSEVYTISKNINRFSNEKTADFLEEWKSTIHNSYLLDITIDILRKKENGEELLEKILDIAGHKGTGLWTAKVALDLGVPIPTITSAMTERIISSKKAMRELLSAKNKNSNSIKIDKNTIRNGYIFARLVALSEGFHLIKMASDIYKWQINISDLAKIWKGGCIIRSDMLNSIISGLESHGHEDHLFSIPSFSKLMSSLEGEAYQLLSELAITNVSTPALSASITYYKSLKTKYLPTNMIQAQRDYFGAHTYRRLDNISATYHTDWRK